MRTEKRWDKIKFDFINSTFPPRIIRDLNKISELKNSNEIKNTFIFGKSGYGKTILACLFLIQEKKNLYFNKQFGDCVFISIPDLFSLIKKSYDLDALEITEQSIISYYGNIHLLVLDEFDIKKPTDWVLEILYSIINKRIENLRITIITSNNNLNEIAKILGDDRITKRIEREFEIIEKKKRYDEE